MGTGDFFKHWKQSFSLFSKKELLLLFFSWINTFKRSFPIFIKYFWWLVIAVVAIRMKTGMMELFSDKQTFFLVLISNISGMFFIYFSVLSIRASVETKNISYFISNLKKTFGFVLIFLFLFLMLNIGILLVSGISRYSWGFSPIAYGLNLLLQVIIGLFLLIAVFFLLDNSNDIVSVRQALCCSKKALIIFSPIFFFFLLFYVLLYYAVLFVFSFFPRVVNITGILALGYFFICVFAVIYSKIRHSNYQLFFDCIKSNEHGKKEIN